MTLMIGRGAATCGTHTLLGILLPVDTNSYLGDTIGHSAM